MDAGCLKENINSPQKQKVENGASPNWCLVVFPPFWEELPMNTITSSPKEGDILHMHIYIVSLGSHPTLIQRGGHTTHAYSFSCGTTPKSSPKGGGM